MKKLTLIMCLWGVSALAMQSEINCWNNSGTVILSIRTQGDAANDDRIFSKSEDSKVVMINEIDYSGELVNQYKIVNATCFAKTIIQSPEEPLKMSQNKLNELIKNL